MPSSLRIVALLTVLALLGCSSSQRREKPMYQDIAAPTGSQETAPTSRGM